MCEIAEVKLMAESLNRVLANQVIIDWTFFDEMKIENSEEFLNALPLFVGEVECKGKILYFHCFNERSQYFLLHSLEIPGYYSLEEDLFARWSIELDNGRTLYYISPRQVVNLEILTDEIDLDYALAYFGSDLFSDSFTLDNWRREMLENASMNITKFLMDQKIFSGCGNYLKCEALHYAKISPKRKVETLTEHEKDKLFEALRVLPRMAYVYKGMSGNGYRNLHGNEGYYDRYLRIYNQKWAKRFKSEDGYVTYWNPKEQK